MGKKTEKDKKEGEECGSIEVGKEKKADVVKEYELTPLYFYFKKKKKDGHHF